jgi:serine/threonine protein kinase/Tol biopolymer transport system component
VGTSKKKIEAIFDKAIQYEDITVRDAYVIKACGDDQKLLARIRVLLEHHNASSFLDSPIFEPEIALDESPLTEGPGTIIGRYKLLEQIGEGGMAVVYMGEQQEPIRRKVALKIIKLGMDTKSVIARFEAERQALAMMDHPNIAKVLDAGATETGRPYFVMELVTGVSITEYCDKNNLSTKERLVLFIQVCNAVQHAHQKGIIHRDIKPTNVMVTHHDGRTIPKIIDFGIAKAINQKLTEKTLFTRYAHIIGTPAYMSPEQAELSDLDVDTRSDIYSLGVLLYELLTGTTPFSEEELRKAGYIEMERIIREEEPVRPSTRLNTLGKTLTDIAKHRSATGDVLTKTIRGDLDWIVMKALEKDRTRRYETANSLGEEIRRYLENKPVLARGPSITYHLNKFLRRHRSKTIAAFFMLVVAGALTVILSMWNQDRLQLDEAESFRHRGILSDARTQYAEMDRNVALETIKPILNSKHVGPEARLLYVGILIDNRRSEEAVAVLEKLVNESPEIAGAAHSLWARMLWESESPDADKLKEIEQHHQRAEALLSETAEAYFLRAMTAITVKDKFASLDRALQIEPSHYESRRLRAFTYYASRKYEKMKDDALGMTILRPHDPLGYSLRAIALRELGRYQEAFIDYNNAIARVEIGSQQYVDLSTQRCQTLLRMGDYERVIDEAQEYLKFSPDKPVFQYHIFCALTALGDYDKADILFRQIIASSYEARQKLQDWCMKYVFDTLETGRTWHPPDREPEGAAFLAMVEAEETYRGLSAKARRVTTDGFSADWSPDGKKLAFSMGVYGYSGVAIYDSAIKETELMIVPGKDPRWSPDGQYISFVRDCRFLRISEFITAERKHQHRAFADEEVWIMNADGTEARHLARGGWPSWSQDSTCIYYHSRLDKELCSVSIEGPDAKPKRIMACANFFPSLSPDNQHVAYLEGASLKVIDLDSQIPVNEWPAPPNTWDAPRWSPTGEELCMGSSSVLEKRTGLWIYCLDRNEPTKTLVGQITAGSWAQDGRKLVFSLCPPYFEIWSAELNTCVSITEALGPARTLEEHFQEMVALYTRRIETDPASAENYLHRAGQYKYLREKAKVRDDMRRYYDILNRGSSSAFRFGKTQNIRRILSGPFGYQFVFSAERPINKIPLLNFAFGQKGRCNMKSFQMPILSTRGLVMSLLSLCLLSGLDTPPAYADITFGEPINLGPTINSASNEVGPSISSDGLELYFFIQDNIWIAHRESLDSEWGAPSKLDPPVNTTDGAGTPCISPDWLTLYFSSQRPGGSGDYDIWVTTRATLDENWGAPVNLGAIVNSASEDWDACVSTDGLELYFTSNRPGGYGNHDIWVSTRATTSDPWGTPVNLGPTINNSTIDSWPGISPDGLLLFFNSNPEGLGKADLYVARRATTKDPWGPPMSLGPVVNSTTWEAGSNVSLDGSTLYFHSNRSGGFGSGDLWQVPIEPVVDFNSDGIVDAADMCIMVEHWLTDYALCDIGPMPWGDGIVDIKDLIVLAEHLFEEIPPAE